MAHRPLTSDEVHVRNWLLSGESISQVAARLSIGKTKINKIIDNLIYFGELVEDYYEEDGKVKRMNPRAFRAPSGKIDDTSPKGEVKETDGSNVTSFETMEPRTAPPTLETKGVSVSKECPEGYVEVHIKGAFCYTVNVVGEMDRIVDARGITYGSVKNEVKGVMKNGYQRTGYLRLFGQEVTFDYRWFPTTGNKFLYIHPGRLYADPKIHTDVDDFKNLLRQRAQYIEYVLAQNGWVLTPKPTFNGRVHVAWVNHPLIKHFDREFTDDNADLSVDTSTGEPELEMEHSEDPLFNEKLRIMSNLPTRIMGIESKIATAEVTNEQLMSEIAGLKNVVNEMIVTMASLGRAQQMQLEFSVKQVQISTNLLKVQSNEANAQMMRTQRSLESFDESDSDGGRPKDTKLEGYQ